MTLHCRLSTIPSLFTKKIYKNLPWKIVSVYRRDDIEINDKFQLKLVNCRDCTLKNYY